MPPQARLAEGSNKNSTAWLRFLSPAPFPRGARSHPSGRHDPVLGRSSAVSLGSRPNRSLRLNRFARPGWTKLFRTELLKPFRATRCLCSNDLVCFHFAAQNVRGAWLLPLVGRRSDGIGKSMSLWTLEHRIHSRCRQFWKAWLAKPRGVMLSCALNQLVPWHDVASSLLGSTSKSEATKRYWE